MAQPISCLGCGTKNLIFWMKKWDIHFSSNGTHIDTPPSKPHQRVFWWGFLMQATTEVGFLVRFSYSQPWKWVFWWGFNAGNHGSGFSGGVLESPIYLYNYVIPIKVFRILFTDNWSIFCSTLKNPI